MFNYGIDFLKTRRERTCIFPRAHAHAPHQHCQHSKMITETETEMKQIQRSERKKPKFCAQKKKIIYMDKRHVRWNIKN